MTDSTQSSPQFAALVWKGAQVPVKKLWGASPVEALTTAVEYLKDGYQVRLSESAVQHFQALPDPGPEFRSAALADGQAAALSGPPAKGKGKKGAAR